MMSCRVNCLDCGCEVLWHDNLTDPPFADHVSGGVDCLRTQLAQAKEEIERLRHAGELLLMCSLPNDVSGVAMIEEARAIIRGEEPKP